MMNKFVKIISAIYIYLTFISNNDKMDHFKEQYKFEESMYEQ